MKNKVSFWLLALIAIIAAAALLFVVVYGEFSSPAVSHDAPQGDHHAPTIRVAGRDVLVDVVDTPESREQGLSGRTGLKADEGMLFIFPEDGFYAFWMRDMRFSIDIVWLSASGTVVTIVSSVSPDTYPRSFISEAPARYVVELPAGFAKRYGLKKGDIIPIPTPIH